MTAETDIKAVPTATTGTEEITLKKAKTEAAPASSSSSNTETPYFKVKKLSEDAVLPKRGSAHAAGYDVCR